VSDVDVIFRRTTLRALKSRDKCFMSERTLACVDTGQREQILLFLMKLHFVLNITFISCLMICRLHPTLQSKHN
jgi:hypothetical protein